MGGGGGGVELNQWLRSCHAFATLQAKWIMDDCGAYIDRDLRVQGAPTGPLAGLTFAVKDLFDVEGHMCVRACVRVCVCVCVRACVCVCGARANVRACVCACSKAWCFT